MQQFKYISNEPRATTRLEMHGKQRAWVADESFSNNAVKIILLNNGEW